MFRRVLITAGPTREHLDPVRFMTNASSGRMGFAPVSYTHLTLPTTERV